jgi:hypothetical protein
MRARKVLEVPENQPKEAQVKPAATRELKEPEAQAKRRKVRAARQKAQNLRHRQAIKAAVKRQKAAKVNRPTPQKIKILNSHLLRIKDFFTLSA